MAVAKITISLDADLLRRVDRLVTSQIYASRSQAVQTALEDKLSRLEKRRLAEECAKLDRAEEQALAEEGLSEDAELWPPY